MKKLLLNTLLLVVTGIFSLITANAQTMPPIGVQNKVIAYPLNPNPSDSIYVAYSYISPSSCPDYYLAKDSVVGNRIYVSKKKVNITRVCATVITSQTAILNLGLLKENTQLFFEGTLIKTVLFTCYMDRKGEVITGTGDCSGQLYIREITIYLTTTPDLSAIPRLWALPKATGIYPNGSSQLSLKAGDKVNFGGTEVKTDSNTISPCRIVGVTNCYEVTSTPPPVGCVKDKKGIVVSGEKECANQLFIQEYSPISSARQLYIIQGINSTGSNGTVTTGLKVGDQVVFGGYPLKNDTSATYGCRTVGVATCYEVTPTPPPCVMDKVGIVTEFKDNSTLVKDSLTKDIYAINNVKLTAGTYIKFKGTKIVCITTPCYNIVDCYTIISTPPVGCVKDKKGIVVSGEKECANQLFIQEYSPISSARQLYIIQGINATNSNGTVTTGLKVGDQVLFGGYPLKNDTSSTYGCRTVGVATCYEITSTPPPCVMDKVGIVTEYKDYSTLVKDSLTGDIYAINNVKLATGTYIKFKGTKIVCVKAPCYNIVDCYTIISTPPVGCVKDKAGVVVAGIDGCSGQLFIEETTPYMSPIRRLYSIKYMVEPYSTVPVQLGLKVGDKVKFGGYLTPNDSNKVILCYTIGVATCYEVISTPPPACVMDKTGVVVPGIDGCTGQLFIRDTSSPNTMIQLYSFKNIDPATNSTLPAGLKAGDKVKFGGYLLKNDSTMSILCPIAGIATCYEKILAENTFSLTGSAFAGTELMKSGLAILYKKGYFKAIASNPITNGAFTFANLPGADYTVYVIPDITIYKNYLPTFYINKIRYKRADYLTLDKNVSDMVVNLKQFKLPVGTGKITGNIFFESYNLKDSVLVDNGMLKAMNVPMNNSAINTPVVLYNGNSEPVAWTTTDVYGNYTFENIPFDSYTVVSETASAEGESSVNLTSGNSTANADVLLKSTEAQTNITEPGEIVLNVYPNPVLDKLTITLAVSEKIEIYSTMGELLIQRNLISGDNTIDLSAIQKGVYFARIGKTTIKVIKK